MSCHDIGRDKCNSCYKKVTNMLQCSKCKFRYCSKEVSKK